MKVAITVKVEIDVESWQINYGTPRSEINADVKTYATNLVTEHFRDLGVLAKS